MCYGFGMIVGVPYQVWGMRLSCMFLLLLLLLCCERWHAMPCTSDQKVAMGNRFSSSTMDSRDRNSGIRFVGQMLLASK